MNNTIEVCQATKRKSISSDKNLYAEDLKKTPIKKTKLDFQGDDRVEIIKKGPELREKNEGRDVSTCLSPTLEAPFEVHSRVKIISDLYGDVKEGMIGIIIEDFSSKARDYFVEFPDVLECHIVSGSLFAFVSGPNT